MNKDSDNLPAPDDTTEEAISPAPLAGSMRDSLIGTKIGSCTLKRVIGSGGMGTVYEAVQEHPRRRVALKMMKRGIASRSALRRFEFESQTLARLQHVGIAQVYEAGTHDDGFGGVPYFVMEYIVNAKSITQYSDEKKLGTKDRLSIFAKVCDAVQHGHLKSIVHRDLKPGNILVDPNGQPKVIDFGVARSTDSDMAVTTLQTDVGQLIGTLQYMSPEQCEADPSDIDVRSDVYALGVILYELLTGNLPYNVKNAAIHEAVRIVREEVPTKLSSINRHLRGDIELIAMTALEKERERRYQSSGDLAKDIRGYLEGGSISARAPTAWAKYKRFNERKIKVTFGLVIALILFSVFVMAKCSRNTYKGVMYSIEAQEQRELATNHAETSEALKQFLEALFTKGDNISDDDTVFLESLLVRASRTAEEHFKKSRSLAEQKSQAEIQFLIGNSYWSLGKYQDAELHLLACLEYQQRVLGEEDPKTIESINNLVSFYYASGNPEEAKKYRDMLPSGDSIPRVPKE